MSGQICRWLPGLALGLSLAGVVGAQNLSHDPRPRSRSVSPARESVACGPTSITESVTQNIVGGNSIACQDSMSGFTLENHYWRAFDLPTFGINGSFDVCEIQIGVETAVSVGGMQPLSVFLYSTTVATFPAGTLTPIGNVAVSVPDQDQTFLTVPVTGSVPPNSALVVEVISPDGTNDLFAFFIGSNADGQTAPSYLSAATCGIGTPTDLAALMHPEMQIVMTVSGTESVLSPVALKVDAANNGVLEPGEPPVLVSPTWSNAGGTAVALTGATSNFVGPGPLVSYGNPDASGDYGTIGAGASAECLAPCYSVNVTVPPGVPRPMQHWDATIDESVVIGLAGAAPLAKTWTLHIGNSFDDVPAGDLYYPATETIFHNGVTAGCGTGTSFCPTQPNLRSEMAVFLLKSSQGPGYAPPACVGLFTDVPCPATPAFPFSDWIEDLALRGITAGCASDPGPPPTAQYCPDRDILRSEMAVFLLKMSLGTSYAPPPCTGLFTDVPCPATPAFPFSDWIEDLFNRSVTAGCASDPGPPPTQQFCPDRSVARQEMAVFLTKTFSLLLYAP